MKNWLIIAVVVVFGSGYAWDVNLLRSWSLGAHGMSAPGIFDLDGDSVPEILVPGNSRLFCYDTTGNERFSFTPLSHYFPAVSSPVAADIDNNGTIEIVFSTPAAVYALSANGSVVWSRTLNGEGAVQNCISSVALGDVNHDGRLEVFAYEVYANRLLCLNPVNGDTIWTYHPQGHPRFSVGTPTVADLNLDGNLEILGQVADSFSGGYLYCLKSQGEELWKYNTPGSGIGGWQLASAAVADLNNDESLEVVTTANYWGIVCLSARGRELWRRSISQHAASYPAIADIDGDDTLEIVVALGPSMRCFCGPTGRDKWSFTVDSGYYIVSSPGLADLDGDGLLEVLFAEVKQNNPTDPNRPMWILNCYGQPLWNDTTGTTMSDPTCGDINQDGRLEFLIGPTLRSGYCYWFQVDTIGVVPGTTPWPTLQHDIWRTGWYEYTGPAVGIKDNPKARGNRQTSLKASPNPFVSEVHFQAPADVQELTVFDVGGRRLATLELKNGRVTWQAQGIAPGVYFCQLSGSTIRLIKAR
ncbi:MAG: FG-GAP-like repeat-containing protein [candidate division WOR-3 bacterium]